jgi:hypothetical protein
MRHYSKLLSAIQSSGPFQSYSLAICFSTVPLLIYFKILTFNQALLLSFGLLALILYSSLSKRIVILTGFAIMMFVSSFPSRFVGGLDMLPLVSGTLLYLGLNQNGGESRKPVIVIYNF